MTQTGNFGIDKLQLQTRDFAIKKAGQDLFGFIRNLPQGGGDVPLLLRDGTGREIYANKIFRNTDLANYTVNQFGLLVQFNPSKRFHPYQLISSGSKLSQSVSDIEREMKQAGILADFRNMKLTRIDLTAQNEMRQPCSQYNAVFRLLRGKRCRNQKEYPTGFQFGNTQWQTVAYDKLQALTESKLQGVIGNERNLLRIENKYLKGDVISRTMPFDTIQGLLQTGNADLVQLYQLHLNKKVFNRHLEAEQLYIDFDNEKILLAEIRQQTTSALTAALLHLQSVGDFSYTDALLKFGGIESYRQFLQDSGMNKRTTYRVINQLQKNIALQARIEATKGKVTVSSLMAEMQAKFAA